MRNITSIAAETMHLSCTRLLCAPYGDGGGDGNGNDDDDDDDDGEGDGENEKCQCLK